MKFNFLWAAKGSIKSLHFWNPLRQPRPKLPPGADLPQEPQKFLMPVFLGFTRFLYSQSSPPGLNSVCVLVAQSCPTLCNPVDCSPPGSSVHGILQARILGWVAIPFSRGSSQSRDRNCFSRCRQILYCLSHQVSPSLCRDPNK